MSVIALWGAESVTCWLLARMTEAYRTRTGRGMIAPPTARSRVVVTRLEEAMGEGVEAVLATNKLVGLGWVTDDQPDKLGSLVERLAGELLEPGRCIRAVQALHKSGLARGNAAWELLHDAMTPTVPSLVSGQDADGFFRLVAASALSLVLTREEGQPTRPGPADVVLLGLSEASLQTRYGDVVRLLCQRAFGVVGRPAWGEGVRVARRIPGAEDGKSNQPHITAIKQNLDAAKQNLDTAGQAAQKATLTAVAQLANLGTAFRQASRSHRTKLAGRIRDLAGDAEASWTRLNSLWWAQSLFSPSRRSPYRELDLVERIPWMATDLVAEAGATGEPALWSFFAETCARVVDGFEDEIRAAELLSELVRASSSNRGKSLLSADSALVELVEVQATGLPAAWTLVQASKGRALGDILGEVEQRTGFDPEAPATRRAWSRRVFRELQLLAVLSEMTPADRG